MKFVRWIGLAAASIVGILMLTAFIIRSMDGPIGPFQGGSFQSGQHVAADGVDWSFARDIDTVELQLVEPPQSRTTWILEHDGQIFIPCGIPEFRLLKQWPHQALLDGRALLRIDGRIYPLQLVKLEDLDLRESLSGEIERKYAVPSATPDNTWIFRLDPRAVSAGS